MCGKTSGTCSTRRIAIWAGADYLYNPSVKVVSAWEPHVKNWGPNNGFDYGGRMRAAWLDR